MKKYNRYQLSFPYEGSKIYKTKLLNRAVKKCYREYININDIKEGMFCVTNIDDNTEYRFKVKNNKIYKINQNGGEQPVETISGEQAQTVLDEKQEEQPEEPLGQPNEQEEQIVKQPTEQTIIGSTSEETKNIIAELKQLTENVEKSSEEPQSSQNIIDMLSKICKKLPQNVSDVSSGVPINQPQKTDNYLFDDNCAII